MAVQMFRKIAWPLDHAVYFENLDTGKVVTRFAEFHFAPDLEAEMFSLQNGKRWRRVWKVGIGQWQSSIPALSLPLMGTVV